MSNKDYYNKLIEEYFGGSISASDKADLERQIEIDPDLKNEFDFQNTIIETIRGNRALELKSRLDNITIRWHHMIPRSWKVAAGVTLFSVSSLSAYFLIDNAVESRISTIDLVDGVHIEYIEPTEEIIPEIPEAIMPPEESKDMITREEAKIEKEIIEDKSVPVEKVPSQETIVIVPDIPEDFEEVSSPTPAPEVDDEATFFKPSGNIISEMNITSITDSKHDFHYTFSEGNLRLYGNFKDEPYEIMELNSANGIKMYLYYKNNYYRIDKNVRIITPLEPVNDTTLITELDVLRQNK